MLTFLKFGSQTSPYTRVSIAEFLANLFNTYLICANAIIYRKKNIFYEDGAFLVFLLLVTWGYMRDEILWLLIVKFLLNRRKS